MPAVSASPGSDDASTGQAAQALERKRRPRAVPCKPLATEVVTRLDAHTRVQIEAVALDGERGLVRALFRIGVRVVLVGAIARPRRHVAATHRDGGAGVERGLHGQLVGASFDRRVVQVAVAAQPRDHSARRALDDRIEVGGRWSRRGMERDVAVRVARDPGSEQQPCRILR
jgi:hypothetical protein